MVRLKIKKMENAFGIKTLKAHFGTDNSFYQVLIYSPNGVFKTSFTRTLEFISTGKSSLIEDRITNAPANIELCLTDDNGKTISNDLENKVIVFSRELYLNNDLRIDNQYNELKFLTTDQESKKKADRLIVTSLNEIKIVLKNKFKEAKLDIEKSISYLAMKSFDDLGINDVEKLLTEIDKAEESDISLIDTKKLFQKAYDPIDHENFLQAANNYVSIYEKRLSEELFDDSFNDSNCLSFLESLKKSSFLSLEKKRGLYIKEKPYYEFDKIQEIFNEAINKISNEPEVLAANQDLIKTMGTSQEAQKLKDQFAKNPLLIKQLSLSRKNIILIALKKCGLEVESLLKIVDDTKKEYEKILLEAKEKQSLFEEAIKIYKNRFNPVFDVEIKDKEEAILGLKVPMLSFRHNRDKTVEMDENKIRTLLSSGEKTALNIIAFIVCFEARKKENPIIILDDIVETFDYSNRYAFIEYINEMKNNGYTIIILTHNYEFFRTLSSRIKNIDVLTAYSIDGNVTIEENHKLNRNMEKILEIQNERQLILAIPYKREISIMTKEDTKLLDSCLHYKKDTKDITIGDIIQKHFKTLKIQVDITKKYFDLLFELADKFDINKRYDLESKTILSIACRLLLESKIIKDNYSLINHITEYQLATIKEENLDKLTDATIKLIDKVQISTPEFIHGNSFMYEPLIDIDGEYLLSIYNEIKDLNDNEIWK